MSYIDIDRLKLQQPFIMRNALEQIASACREFTTEEACKATLEEKILLQKSQQIEDYLHKVDEPIDSIVSSKTKL